MARPTCFSSAPCSTRKDDVGRQPRCPSKAGHMRADIHGKRFWRPGVGKSVITNSAIRRIVAFELMLVHLRSHWRSARDVSMAANSPRQQTGGASLGEESR